MLKNYSILFILTLIPTILIVYFFKPIYEEDIDNRLQKSRSLAGKGHLDSAKWELWDIRDYELQYDTAKKLIDSLDKEIEKKAIRELKAEIKKGVKELEKGVIIDWNKYPLGAFYISIIKAAKFGNILKDAINYHNFDTLDYYVYKLIELTVSFQEREFPKMRKMYSLKVDSLLFEENIRVETSRQQNKVLIFSSDKFSESYNWEYLKCSSLEFVRLRFTSIIFKKSTDNKVIKTYTLESDPDSVFGVSLPCGLEFGFLTINNHPRR